MSPRPLNPKIVASEGERLVRLLVRWALALAIAVALGPSSAYTLLAIHHEGEDFEAALDRRAAALSQLAYSTGELWQFEVHRIKDVIEPLRSEVGESTYRVEATDGALITEAGTAPGWMAIRRVVDILDGNRVVGHVVGDHDISHALEIVSLVALASCILGLGFYLLVTYRAVPFLRASIARLDRYEHELAAERAGLEHQVAERTTALSDANLRLEDALDREREINQQQRRFVSVVSHEFRTPLTIIDGAAQRLARNAESLAAADVHERVQKIRRAVARMSELIETSLSAARLDSGAIAPARERIDLSALLGGICDRIRSIAPEFSIEFDVGASDLAVAGDPRLLDQVFTNLLTNAVKYSGASRTVEIELRADDGDAIVAVRDHGLGIPGEEVPKLFTRFYRASTALGLPGTGIGLNLAHDLVAMHGGRIEVASELAVGSTFTVRLPRLAREAPIAVQAA